MSIELKNARENAGITAKELYEKAGVSRALLTNLEKGQSVRYVYAVKIVNALNELAGTSYTVQGLNIQTV